MADPKVGTREWVEREARLLADKFGLHDGDVACPDLYDDESDLMLGDYGECSCRSVGELAAALFRAREIGRAEGAEECARQCSQVIKYGHERTYARICRRIAAEHRKETP